MSKRIPRKLRAFYGSVKLQSPRAQSLWLACRGMSNVFAATAEGAFSAEPPTDSEPEVGSVNFISPWAGKASFLPIEVFKPGTIADLEGPLPVVSRVPPAKVFRSSGTTAQDRAMAPFSADGLGLYRAVSVRTFYDMLAIAQNLPPLKLRPVSLVPSTKVWPDSSLAQMVEWIGELWGRMEYLNVEEFATFTRRHRRRPMFVFGTALHWANFLDTGKRLRLPAGSVIIETGGTKGATIELKRADLYPMLSTALKIPESAIVSEYGMSEMASQAYDWKVPKLGDRLTPRVFRFPAWITPGIMRGLCTGENSGQGALIVKDPLRLDFPAPLRTQDLAALSPNGMFQLEGRVPYAVLKGCSLSVNSVVEMGLPIEGESAAEKKAPPRSDGWNEFHFDPIRAATRLTTVRKLLDSLVSDPRSISDLQLELGSKSAASAALQDLTAAFPKNESEWLKAVQASLGLDAAHATTRCPQHWLVIPPANHSIAALQPICLAAIAGLRISIRMPSDQSLRFMTSFISALGREAGAVQELLPASFRIGKSSMPANVEGLLVYGADETIAALSKATNIPIRGLGSSLCLSVAEFPVNPKGVREIVRDAFSLGQKGCLSSRLLLMRAPDGGMSQIDTRQLARSISDEFREFWGDQIPWQLMVAIDHEAASLDRRGINWIRKDLNSPLLAIYEQDGDQNAENFDTVLSERPFVLPIMMVERKKFSSVVGKLMSHPRVKTIAAAHGWDSWGLPILRKDQVVCQPGAANKATWLGTYESRGFFTVR